jgi:hypothetical protein
MNKPVTGPDPGTFASQFPTRHVPIPNADRAIIAIEKLTPSESVAQARRRQGEAPA